jgi:hypothetical protein
MTEGTPQVLRTDNGKEFRNADMEELGERWGVDLRSGQPYKSNSQGAIERDNETIRSSIFNYLRDRETKKWVDKLPFLVYTYNTSVHSTTKTTPFQVHRRRDEIFEMDAFVRKNILKNAENMVKRLAKTNQKDLPRLGVGKTVRVRTQDQIEVRPKGAVVNHSKKHKGQLYTYTRETYEVLSVDEKEDGTVQYEITGYHQRKYDLRNELQLMDIKTMVKVGNPREELNFFWVGWDLENHLDSFHAREANIDEKELESAHEDDVVVSRRPTRSHPNGVAVVNPVVNPDLVAKPVVKPIVIAKKLKLPTVKDPLIGKTIEYLWNEPGGWFQGTVLNRVTGKKDLASPFTHIVKYTNKETGGHLSGKVVWN